MTQYSHADWLDLTDYQRAVWKQLNRLSNRLDVLLNEEEILMAWIDDMTAEIANNTTVTQSAVVAYAALADQLQTLINQGADPAKLQAFVDTLRANDSALAAAIVAKTPAPPEPAPTPVPPEVTPTP